MDMQLVWDYFGNFNDAEGSRIFVLLMFVIGTPLVVGFAAKLWIWAIRQVRAASRLLEEPPEIGHLEHGR